MQKKTPISLIVDDSCPLVHTPYYSPWIDKNENNEPLTKDGRLLLKTIPNSFLEKYCKIVQHHSIAGKISVIPMPKGHGDILTGIPGYELSLVHEWINIINKKLAGRFDFSPEVLSHMYALNLTTGEFTDKDEETWSYLQDRTTLTPYIAKALQMLRTVGIDASGVTSPWSFGLKVEDEYIAAIVAAQKQVYNRDLSWYFLHTCEAKPETKPWIAYKKDNQILVSIPSTISDKIWDTIDCPRTDEEYINSITDVYITANGSDGGIIKILQAGGWPILCTHWQSLFSNGLETGLKVLDRIGERVNKHLSSEVEWKSTMEIAHMIAEV